MKILEGKSASPGVANGVAFISTSTFSDISDIPYDCILITKISSPDLVLQIERVGAIVVERGGKTSHMALIARELGIPCVVDVCEATSSIKNGANVTVDGNKGEIRYK